MIEWLQHFPQHSQNIARVLFEFLIVAVPMPWRISVALLIGIIVIYLFVWRLLPSLLLLLVNGLFGLIELIISLLLLPEYIITRQLRSVGWQPLWGTYVYGGLLGGVVWLAHAPVSGFERGQQWRFPWFVLILLAVLPVGLWYIRPSLEGMSIAHYVDVGFLWWRQLENWLLHAPLPD